ncbi:cation-transporting P-type ATPase [Clostridium sp. 19966]|uniref:P-type ATPase n=1 Tax=Clostridium sp. 19966 TaxID=2768166 RepID=UPI0028DFC876|nr:cation-transporting P-type ATPase [Clostridium sp. 19966]MDT8715297.1 cation-transporting P-type ATPase [Clostridium sp. 19966]
MVDWYRKSWSAVVNLLKSDGEKGLKSDEIELRRRTYGDNNIKFKIKNYFFEAIRVFMQIWFIAAVLDICILIKANILVPAFAVSVITLIVIALQLYYIINRYNNFKNVIRLNNSMVNVIRDGTRTKIKSKELVVGDIVNLIKGDVVPADMRIVYAEKLKVREGNLSGDSNIVEKYSTKIDEEIENISLMKNMLFKTTNIINGYCKGIVVAAGKSTKAYEQLNALNNITIGNKRRVASKIKGVFAVHALIVFLFEVIIGAAYYVFYNNSYSIMEALRTVFLVTTVNGGALVLLMFLAIEKAFINNKESEVFSFSPLTNLCNTDVFIMDKYGTTSENKMIVKFIFTDDRLFSVKDIHELRDYNILRMFQLAVLCNNYSGFDAAPKDYNGIIDESLVDYVENHCKYDISSENCRKISMLPFDPERKLLTFIYEISGKYRACTRGYLTSILDSCTFIMKDGVETELHSEDIDLIKKNAMDLESRGLNVVAFACRNFNYQPTLSENIESNMVFVGVFAMQDLQKDNADEFLKEIMELEIEPIFITDDTKLASFGWAKSLGLVKNINEILTGVEIDNISDTEFKKLSKTVKVYSKISPENKAKVVQAVKDNGFNVACTIKQSSDIASASLSDINIAIRPNLSGVVRALTHISITDRILENLLKFIYDGYFYINKIDNTISFILSTLCSVLLVYLYTGSNSNISESNFNKIFWINFFNVTILAMVILLDKVKDRNDYIAEIKYERQPQKVINIVMLSYIKAVFILIAVIVVKKIIEKYIAIDMYLLLNIILMISVNFYRIKGKKAITVANILYGVMIMLNIAMIVTQIK